MIPVGNWHVRSLVLGLLWGFAGQMLLPQASLAAGYATVILADHPSAYWRLGEASGATSVADSSGQNHTASVFGPVVLGASGAILGDTNTAARLNGQTAYIRGASAMAVTADFTLEAWVKPATATASGSIVSLTNGNSSRMLYLSGGQILAMADVSATWPSYTVFGPTLDTSWHHVVFATGGGTVLSLYVDGRAAGSATVGTRAGFSANPVIGWTDATWMSKLAGTIDEVALYPTALSAARVAAHYSAATAPACGTSLQSLVDAASAGSTINVPACVYRETVTIPKSLTLVGQAGAEIRGSDVWSAWSATGSTWVSQKSVPPLPTVSDDPNACDPGTNNRCLWPEQVYVDGQALSQVAAGTPPSAGQFGLVSASDRRVVIGSNPSGHVVEVTTRPSARAGLSPRPTA
jgi:hypothetical protein